jgi:hypothetical protein
MNTLNFKSKIKIKMAKPEIFFDLNLWYNNKRCTIFKDFNIKEKIYLKKKSCNNYV